MSAPQRVQQALDRVAALSEPASSQVTGPETPPIDGVSGPRVAARGVYRAVVVRTDDSRLSRCLSYATGKGYHVAVADATTALTMVADGTADVIVAADGEDLPFFEIAASGLPRQRRPRPTAPSPERGLLRRPQLRGPFGD